jgi:(p)ppGpp synthase/HD superfamily hydrolase
MEQIILATQIAWTGHSGQFRRDGVTPYFSHVYAVAMAMDTEDEGCVGILHDILEDTDETRESLIEKGIALHIVDAVEAMTKQRGDDYKDYLNRVKSNELARKVKIQDMLHNLSDSPTEKQIKKYTEGLEFLRS